MIVGLLVGLRNYLNFLNFFNSFNSFNIPSRIVKEVVGGGVVSDLLHHGQEAVAAGG